MWCNAMKTARYFLGAKIPYRVVLPAGRPWEPCVNGPTLSTRAFHASARSSDAVRSCHVTGKTVGFHCHTKACCFSRPQLVGEVADRCHARPAQSRKLMSDTMISKIIRNHASKGRIALTCESVHSWQDAKKERLNQAISAGISRTRVLNGKP